MDCIFCKINEGIIPSYTLYEDDLVRVFLDINPDVNGHILIIPKNHILDITEMESDLFSHILKITKDMKKLLEDKLEIDGLTLVQNNGIVQEVKHFHLHLKPVYNEKQPIKDAKEIFDILTSK